ncbi:MAG TPA: helix-turn-helix domain-containing protein [Cellulomonadaceae bacterium]|nr:helix-turn-helix domain-containing protein [Cellulomonadaceae bacterium]
MPRSTGAVRDEVRVAFLAWDYIGNNYVDYIEGDQGRQDVWPRQTVVEVAMSTTALDVTAHRSDHDGETGENDESTRDRVLQIVASDGPVTAAQLARGLRLTTAAIRRHLSVLEGAGRITVHEPTACTGQPTPRGRPARRYVVTGRGQAALSNTYPELAGQALRLLEELAGRGAVMAFAERRLEDLERRHAPELGAAGADLLARVQALASGLTSDGYAATARPIPGMATVQLCQGHCPVQQVAAEFPELCEAETHTFSRLLGVHVQRLSTLAAGGHVCTTNIPIGALHVPAEGIS